MTFSASDFMMYSFFAMVTLAFWFPRNREKDGFLVMKYQKTSKQNPITQVSGHSWTSFEDIQYKLPNLNKPTSIHLDNFKFFKSNRTNKSGIDAILRTMPRRYRRRIEKKTKAYIEALTTTKGLVFVGEMGSGKTVTFNHLLSQNFYNRALIHDAKMDYIKYFFRYGVDILMNPFDSRNTVWDILSESPTTIETFFSNLMTAIAGGKIDYFSAAAQKKFRDIALKTTFLEGDPILKWKKFTQDVEDLFYEVKTSDQRSEKDVISSMDQVLDIFKLMSYQIQNGQETFTIRGFFAKNNQNKIFLANNSEFEKSLNPLFGAFLACFSQIHMSIPDTKKDLTLYLLDEYLSFASIIDETSRRRLHTMIRSKGGMLYVGLQGIPGSDKKLEEDLTSSAFAYMIFSVKGKNNKAFVQTLIGIWKYQKMNISKSNSGETISWSEPEEKILEEAEIDMLAQDYSHVTIIPTEGILYKGTSPLIELTARTEPFERYDLIPFVKHIIGSNEKFEERIKNEKNTDNKIAAAAANITK
ncbi:MAG: hypothetical protein COA44_04665 [Arcobacter sp.]|nr:MAG: hypothetical protein COA44_04665 [Arcobacter sp.]